MPAKCKERERIMKSGTADIPSLPLGAVRGNLCFRCFSPSSSILKCSGCRRAGYCSKECQKLDWSLLHKNHCKIFKTINAVEEQQYQSTRTWAEYREYLLKIVRSIRDAAPHDNDLRFVVQAQGYCGSCRRSAVQLSSRKVALNRCNNCRLFLSCSDCTATHLPSVCGNYQNYIRIEEFRISYFEDMGKASPITCTQIPRKTRKLLANATGWYDYFVDISDKSQIKEIIKPDFSSLTEGMEEVRTPAEKESQERMRMFLLWATDNLTMPLSIVSALEDISWEKSYLKIHLLGATGREMLALGNFEEILHLVPGLKEFHITAIGPETWAGNVSTAYVPKTSLECCAMCKADGRSRSVAFYQGLYHDFAKISDYEKPDLVVSFNSGFVDGDDAGSHWDATIRMLVDGDVPALFTTYNAGEAHNEKVKMTELKAKFLVLPEKNKWSGLIPTPEFIDEEYGMWFQNAYRYIIHGKT